MISPAELDALLADIESDRIEFTRSTTDTGKFSEAVCAFANDMANHRLPGYLVIGVDDRTRTVANVVITDSLLQTLASLRNNGTIQPMPRLIVEKLTYQGGDIAVVEVYPSELPPVRYNGRCHIRIGPRRATASIEEERVLSEIRISHARSFDALPVVEATIDDLAIRTFSDFRSQAVDSSVIDENHRSIVQQLSSLRFFDHQRGCPTNAGILLFGKNPRYFLPGAYVQFLQMPGTTLTDEPLDQAEISGDLATIMNALELRVQAGNKHQLVSTSVLQEQLIDDYPVVAIREVLNNAVVHRNYESNTPIKFYWFTDRIEIHSPGGLYGEVTRQTIRERSSYRNPVIADAMKTLGFVNKFGYGIARAEAALQKNGNAPLRLDIEDNVVAATMRKRV
jgi:ATP-dependent DNA helicase RecG